MTLNLNVTLWQSAHFRPRKLSRWSLEVRVINEVRKPLTRCYAMTAALLSAQSLQQQSLLSLLSLQSLLSLLSAQSLLSLLAAPTAQSLQVDWYFQGA